MTHASAVKWALPLALLGLLASCGALRDGLPNGADIDVNGSYTGRIVGSDGRSILLDTTLVEQNERFTATVRSPDNGQVLTLQGTRSVHKASPVSVDVVQETGGGSACARGLTDRYQVDVTFYARSEYSSEGARGVAQHEVCDTASGTSVQITDGSGSLELVRK